MSTHGYFTEVTRRISDSLLVAGSDMVRVVDDLVEGGGKSLMWRGHFCWKNPVDLIVYAEIVNDTRPDLVIETGTHAGGSALFWIDMMRLNGSEGMVVSVDSVSRTALPSDLGITYLVGSSTDPTIVRKVRETAGYYRRVLVNLDSDHSQTHVAAELRAYHDLVTPGSYLIVEDGIDDFRWNRKGPYAATLEFLAGHPEFEPDRHRERFGLTNNPSGFLRRTG